MPKKRERETAKAVRRRMEALLAQVPYDFGRFTMDSFVEWLERHRSRRIRFKPWPLPPPVYGAWIPRGDCDFIFYNRDTSPLHQAHIQLHEMCHILCEHSAVDIDSPAGQAFFNQLLLQVAGDATVAQGGRWRSPRSDAEEIEAETLASLIQREIHRHSRLHEISIAYSLNTEFESYFAEYASLIGVPE